MAKKVASAIICCFISVSCHADSILKKLGIRPYIGISAGSMSPINENGAITTNFIGGAQTGIYAKYLGVSVYGLYYNRKDNRDFKFIPIMFNLYGRFPIRNLVSIRLGGGTSYILPSEENIEYKNHLGYQLHLGVDIKLSEHFTLGTDTFILYYYPKYTRSWWFRSNEEFSEQLDLVYFG